MHLSSMNAQRKSQSLIDDPSRQRRSARPPQPSRPTRRAQVASTEAAQRDHKPAVGLQTAPRSPSVPPTGNGRLLRQWGEDPYGRRFPAAGEERPCTSGQYKATLMYLPIISINSFLFFECCSPTLQAPAAASGSIWTRTHRLAQVAKLNVRTSIGFAWFRRWEWQWLHLCR